MTTESRCGRDRTLSSTAGEEKREKSDAPANPPLPTIGPFHARTHSRNLRACSNRRTLSMIRRRFRQWPALPVVLALSWWVVATALPSGHAFAEFQNEQIGFSPNHVFDGVLQGENVDIMTGNVNLNIPLGPRYQLNDWFGYQVQLYYNSRVWKHDCSYVLPDDPCEGTLIGSDTYGQGVRISFGSIYRDEDDRVGVYRYQSPSGGEHFFCSDVTNNECNGLTDFTFDESTIRIASDPDPNIYWSAWPGNGTIIRFGHFVAGAPNQWHATRVETVERADNGIDPQHYYDINYTTDDSIASIVDSLGRTISFQTIGVGPSIEILFPGLTTPYELSISSATIEDPSDRSGSQHTETVNLLDALILPELDPQAGESYLFIDYDFGSLSEWSLPTGANVKYYYTAYQTSFGRPFHRNMYLRRLNVDGVDHDWTYTRYGDGVITDIGDYFAQYQGELSSGSNPRKVKVLDPFNNLTVYWFHRTAYDSNACVVDGCDSHWADGMLEAVDTYAGPDENATRLVRRVSNEYTYDEEDFQFKSAGPGPSRVNSVAVNSRRESTRTHTPPQGGYPGGDRRVVSSDWNTAGVTGTRYKYPPRARLVTEYNDAEVYRSTYTQYPGLVPWEFQGVYDYSESRDSLGSVISRTDVTFDHNRIKCRVRRASGTGLASLPSDCDDPLQVAGLAMGPGDVASLTTLTYNETTEEETRELVTHGFDSTGDRYESESTSYRGVVSEGEYVGLTESWLAVDRTIDPDTGRVVSSRDPSGIETEYTWDDLGRLTRIDPELPERPIEIFYDDVQTTRVRQELSSSDYTETIYEYDQMGRLVTERRRDIGGDLDFRKTEYDISGRVTQRSEWADQGTKAINLAWTSFEYEIFPNPNPDPGEPSAFTDPLSRVSKVTRPDGSTTETTYGGLSTSVTISDIQGPSGLLDATTIYTNDVFGRLVSVDSPGAGADAVYEYDERDNMTEVRLTDPAIPSVEQIRRFTYDGLGRLRSATHPESGTTEYLAYDARGKLLNWEDTQHEYFNEYDAAGRLTEKSVVLSGTFGPTLYPLVENTYDDDIPSFGKLSLQKSYRATPGGTLLASTLHMVYGGGQNVDCSSTLNGSIDAYDGLNGRISSSSMTIEPWGKELKTKYCYDKNGATYLVGYPDSLSSGRTRTSLSHLYVNGHLWGVQDLTRDLEYVEGISYHPTGAVEQFTRGNGVLNTVTRDDQGRPASFDVSAPATPARHDLATLFACSGGGPADHCTQNWGALSSIWDSGTYSYDGAGNVSSIGANNTYAYDELNRLVGANVRDDGVPAGLVDYAMSYVYDGFGNMLQRDRQIVGGTLDTNTFAVDPMTNRLAGLQYDARGNLLDDGNLQFDFGPDNRLYEIWDGDGSLVASYSYDASGYRIRAATAGIETFYFRDAAGQLLSEYQRADGETDDPVWNRDYIYALGQTFSVVKNQEPEPVGKPRSVSVDSTEIEFEWDAVPDPDIDSYMIWRETDDAMELPQTYTVDCDVDDCVNPGFTETITGVSGAAFKYKVRAIDDAANSSTYSPEMIVRPNDGVAPSKPSTPTVEAMDGAVKLTWTPNSEDDVQGYAIDRRGFGATTAPWATITVAPVEQSLFIDHGVVNGGKYKYRIRAVDTAGNESVNSAVSAFVNPRDWNPPARPTGVQAAAAQDAGEVIVVWDAVLDPDLRGYQIFRSDTQGALGDAICNGPWEGTLETFCETAGLAIAYLDADPTLVDGQTYYYTMRSIDTSTNLSMLSDAVSATTREASIGVPTSVTAEFHVEEVGAAPPAAVHPYNYCEVDAEDDDVVGVRVRWLVHASATTYRVYRTDFAGPAPGGNPVIFNLVAEIDPAIDPADPQGYMEWVDTNLNGYEYQYYVVSVNVGESPASVAADAVDTYDEAAFVRNLRAIDGRESFPTQNSRSRRVTLRWSRVPEQQLAGYHVYRRCEWEYSEPAAASWPSHDGRDCVHSWVRLTDSPISSVRVFEDRPGGLNGAYLYSVRPVGPGATAGSSVEGPVFKLLELDLTTNGHEGNPNFEEDGVPAQCYDSVSTEDIDTKVSGGAQLEIDRINAIDKGTGSATGAPAQPANVVIQFRTQAPTSVLKTYTLRWDANTEADLAGYYVEMAGAANGPWERLNDQPVAWWETSFDVKGLDSDSVGPGACAHFRVIAVDDSGLESSPSDPIDEEYVATTPPTLLSYTPPSCGGFTLAPPAPQDLVVTTETLGASSPFHCENLLEWSEVSGASDYYIYRYAHYWTIGSWPTHSGYYFYRTHELPASPCSGGTCSYIESGDLPTGGSGVNDGCPWGDDNCYLDKLETYYVTAVYDNGSGGKSGESPRSALVFWNCSEFNGIEEGYTGLIDARPRVPAWFEREAVEESPILLADSRPAECPVEPASWPLAESPQLVLARPLTLGKDSPWPTRRGSGAF